MRKKIWISLAIGLFVGKQSTLACCAEIARKPLADFIGILHSYIIPWAEYTEEHFSEDVIGVQELIWEKEGNNQ